MDESPASSLSWTGERLMPGMGGDILLEHLHRYALAREWAGGLEVLDVASGEGYGSALLAEVAGNVTGVDLDPAATAHAAAAYVRPNLRFLTGSATALPLAAASVDLAVSFETIEHLTDHEGMLRELRRVLRPGGWLILSSPDRREYSEASHYQNPFHLKELDGPELQALLRRYFPVVRLLGQRLVYGSAVVAKEGAQELRSYTGDSEHISVTPGLPRPRYWLALCSDEPLPPLPSSLWLDEPQTAAFASLAGTYEITPARHGWRERWRRLLSRAPSMYLDPELPCAVRAFTVTLRGTVPPFATAVRVRLRDKVFSGEISGKSFAVEVAVGRGRHICLVETCTEAGEWTEALRVRVEAPEVEFKAYRKSA